MNAVDTLFENVLDQLPRDIEEPLLHGHEDSDPGEMDPIDEPPDTTSDEINPYWKDSTAGGIRTRGFDALAFYKSRRLIAAPPFPGKSGMFYLKAGLVHVAWGIAETYPGYAVMPARAFLELAIETHCV
ncbi:MAG: hypothetical protein ACREDV_12670 [Methylocella sp.]